MSPITKRIIDFSVMLGALISILTAAAYVARPHAEEFVKQTADAYVAERLGALDVRVRNVERQITELGNSIAENSKALTGVQATIEAQKDQSARQTEEIKSLLLRALDGQ